MKGHILVAHPVCITTTILAVAQRPFPIYFTFSIIKLPKVEKSFAFLSQFSMNFFLAKCAVIFIATDVARFLIQ